MSEIMGFKCDVCKAEATMNLNDYKGGPTVMEILRFTLILINGVDKLHACKDCTPQLRRQFQE